MTLGYDFLHEREDLQQNGAASLHAINPQRDWSRHHTNLQTYRSRHHANLQTYLHVVSPKLE